MFPRSAALISTKYCTISVKGDVMTTQRRLIACPAPDGKMWCVRSRVTSFDHKGGGEQHHPFSYKALLKDSFNAYKDYTLSKAQALSELASFERRHTSFAEPYHFPETHVQRELIKDAWAPILS